jgi:hypothetical protein
MADTGTLAEPINFNPREVPVFCGLNRDCLTTHDLWLWPHCGCFGRCSPESTTEVHACLLDGFVARRRLLPFPACS